MAKKTLVIVESPTKAKTLQKHLGRNYEIKASMGHVRDLPKSRMAIDIENDFQPEYILVRGKGKVAKELRAAAKKADRVLLAADPDREGEAIAWHLSHILELDPESPCRIRMYEITKAGIKEAVKNPEKVDLDRVDAQQARRILDRLVGYRLSPLLWSKIRSGLSAGRVQSVALRLICDREKEIEAFTPEEYWLIDVDALAGDGREYKLRVEKEMGKNLTIPNEEEAMRITGALRQGELVVSDFKTKEGYRNPLPPFRTSTLQQEAGRRLGFSPKKTMRVAQSLYEGLEIPGRGPTGLITYMRTDSLRISDAAQTAAREFIGGRWGQTYLPEKPQAFSSKGRSQDAHEAIRPTDASLDPQSIRDSLSKEQFQLYEMIWKRFLASQMAPARIARTTMEARSGDFLLKQSGVTLIFEGWGVLWPLDLKEGNIPPAEPGETLGIREIHPEQKFTKPPARFAESGLVKVLEDKDVGRPSTYAAIVSTLFDRGYVEKQEDKKLHPTELGRIVSDFLVQYFEHLVNTGFTAHMEDELDDVETGQRSWLDVVREFWGDFEKDLDEAHKNAERVELPVKEIGEDCPQCGAPLVIKRGRFGEFIACSAYPDCKFSRPILRTIGVKCPKCGEGDVVRRRSRKGRFFYGCSRYPECDFVSWGEPTGEKCSECGELLIKKKKKGQQLAVCPSCGLEKKIGDDDA